ncbi:hypothetical protein V1515DRAFT_145358 [Lipomyces mesembrius]
MASELPYATHAYCCQHLCENLMKLHPGGEVRKLLWQAARAFSKAKFQAYIEAIHKIYPAAAQYLKEISAQYWANYAVPTSRYGHLTSNIVESVNSLWLDIRSLPILIALQIIWHSMMEKFYIRRTRNFQSELTEYAQNYVNTQCDQSRRYLQYLVRRLLLLFLKLILYKAYMREDIQIPCSHALAVIRDFKYSINDYEIGREGGKCTA